MRKSGLHSFRVRGSRSRHRIARALHGVGAERSGSAAGDHGLQRRPAIPYTVPKTPWGDPDLQGVWSSDDTQGIPMQRAAERGPACIRPTSSGPRARSRSSKASRMRENAIGTFRSDFARRAFRQTSLIVDPPTAGSRGHARSREAARAARPRDVRRWSVRQPGRFHAVRPLHHPRHRRLGRCASSTATATASCRRRAWSRSATR